MGTSQDFSSIKDMNLESVLKRLPENSKSAVVILSGGMDSTIALRLAYKHYKGHVSALSFDYGQRQVAELQMASATCSRLSVQHKIVDLRFLGEMGKGFSANLDTNIKMPTIKEVLGHPRPVTYVPNRNMIMLSIAAAYAEVQKHDTIICGLQARDEYAYHDTSSEFVEFLNRALGLNRIQKIRIIAPFNDLKKSQEIRILKELDGNADILKTTLTCYNPDINLSSCGVCPTCAERIKAFAEVGIPDPITYSIKINWPVLIEKEKNRENRA